MGYKTKIQKVSRPTNNSFYVNLPAAIAEAIEVEKGELFEWIVNDRNTLILKRRELKESFINKEVKD
jgi:antitoxin component of MazEF toxin-antitoxin module